MRLDGLEEGMEIGPFWDSVIWKELRMRNLHLFGNILNVFETAEGRNYG